MIIYVGDANDVIKRILTNHCGGNVEASALRATIAQEMGYHLRRTKRPSGSTRVRIDLPNPREGENIVSRYIRSCAWRYVICESYEEDHDFQWYAIDRLKPLLNKNRQPWNTHKIPRYQNLFHQLLRSEPLSCNELRNRQSGPGVYVLFHEPTPRDFKTS